MSNSRRKITFIGAGSTVFAKNLIGDILSFPELADSVICLFDIDENRLKVLVEAADDHGAQHDQQQSEGDLRTLAAGNQPVPPADHGPAGCESDSDEGRRRTNAESEHGQK